MAGFAGGWLSERDIRAGSRMRLFCLPHAGAGAAAFYRWKRALPASVDVCPVLLPGREIRLREPLLTSAAALVDALAAAVEPFTDVPFAIFGHSLGALLAFEWARRAQPATLFVSGRNAPHHPVAHRELHRLPDEPFLAALRERYAGLPDDFLSDPELRSLFLPILRADLAVVETHRFVAGDRLHCPLLAFAGRDDRTVSPEGLLAWAELTSGEFTSTRLPGDHFHHFGAGESELLRIISEQLQHLLPPPIAPES